MDKLEKQMKDDVKHLAPLPTPSATVGELDELSEISDRDLKQVDRSFVMHELASVGRVRDYINHVEASVRRDSWAVTMKMDTTILSNWLRDADAYQIMLNNEETANRAIAPEAIQLLSDELFSIPMYMGKRDANVKRLNGLRATSGKDNRARIDVIIDLYASGKMPNYLTAEGMVMRLASKSKRRDYNEKTDREYAKLVGKYGVTESTEENIMITLLLFREKEVDDKKKSDQDITVNIDFREGTTTAEALAIKKNIREAGAKGTKKMKHLQGLEQFYYGDFEARVTKADLKWLKEDVTERMLLRKDELTKEAFFKLCKWLRKRNSIFDDMMDRFGDSYLAAIYPLKVRDAHSQLNRAFIPKQAKTETLTRSLHITALRQQTLT